MSENQNRQNSTTTKHRLEEDVTLSNGEVVRVTGLWAVQYRKDPEAVRKEVEEVMTKTRGRKFGDQSDAE